MAEILGNYIFLMIAALPPLTLFIRTAVVPLWDALIRWQKHRHDLQPKTTSSADVQLGPSVIPVDDRLLEAIKLSFWSNRMMNQGLAVYFLGLLLAVLPRLLNTPKGAVYYVTEVTSVLTLIFSLLLLMRSIKAAKQLSELN